MSTRKLAKQMTSKGRTISASTIQRRVKEGKAGLKCRSVVKKPLLTEDHKTKRVEFAEENKGSDWKYIVFSDSCIFNYHHKDKAEPRRKWVK